MNASFLLALAAIFTLISVASVSEAQDGGSGNLERFCKSGNLAACNNLGVSYSNAREYSRAAGFYKKACDGGEPNGCVNLGDIFDAGLGTRQDKGKAADLYKKACELGFDHGCYSLGYAHQVGDGVKKDRSRMLDLYERSCKTGHGAACLKLGAFHLDGKTLPFDTMKAGEYYKKAAESSRWRDRRTSQAYASFCAQYRNANTGPACK